VSAWGLRWNERDRVGQWMRRPSMWVECRMWVESRRLGMTMIQPYQCSVVSRRGGGGSTFVQAPRGGGGVGGSSDYVENSKFSLVTGRKCRVQRAESSPSIAQEQRNHAVVIRKKRERNRVSSHGGVYDPQLAV
jgi:hypothetical protein